MVDVSAIIEEINDQLDAEAFVRLLKYHPDKIQISGSTLKCFCPVHHELAFRSLIINLKNKVYKCTMKRCLGFEGGNLVHLWSLCRELGMIEAALDLAEQLKLPIDVQTLRRLGSTYAEKARAERTAGDLEEARRAIDQALAFDPRNADLRLLSADIWLGAGQTDKAAQEELGVLDAYLAAQNMAPARSLLDALLARGEPRRVLLERDIDLIRLEGRTAPLSAALVRLAEVLLAEGQLGEAIGPAAEACQIQPEDASLLQGLALLYEQAGRQGELIQTLERLSALYADQKAIEPLAAVLERRVALSPDEPLLRERLARTLELAGKSAAAREQWLSAVQNHSDQGRYGEGEKILAALLEHDPREVDLLERQAQMLARAGETTRAVTAYRHLAILAQEVGLAGRVSEYFELARAIDPHDLGLRRDQAEWKLAAGDLDGGMGDLFTLADLCLERGENAEGMAILVRIAALAPSDLDKRLRIGRCLERNGLENEAFASYCLLASDFMRQQQLDAAQAICEEARRLRPRDPQTLELRIETHLALKQKSEAIEACREVAREFLAAGDPSGAERVLQRGIKIDRSETQAKIDLARLYEQGERPGQASQLWIEMALFHRAQGDNGAAIEATREALRLEPANREARVMLAEGLEAAGALGEALERWEQLGEDLAGDEPAPALKLLGHALELAPRKRPLLARVARLTLEVETAAAAQPFFTRWLEACEAPGEGVGALEAYRLAVATYPDQDGWRARLAAMLLEAGERDEAADQFEALLALYHERQESSRLHAVLEQLVALRPERLDLRAELGDSLVRLGCTRESLRIFSELGEHHMRNGDLEPALAMFMRTLAINPDHTEFIARAADLLERLGRTEEAIAHYERLAELHRHYTDTSINIPVLEKLLAYQPERLELWAELAELCEADGDIDQAIAHHFTIARRCAETADQLPRAIAVCQRIGDLAPEFIPARELLVECWLNQGELAPAKDELDRLGDAALAVGKLEQAEGYFKRIREIDPDDIGSGERLGKLYEAHGRLEEAAEAFQHVLELYEKNGETARAIGVLQKLKQLRPEDLDLRGRLGRMLLEHSVERREAAEEWFTLIELALERGERTMVESSLAEIIPYFRQDWPWRIRVAHRLTAAGQDDLAIQAWQGLATDALEGREFGVAREAAGEGLTLTPDQTQLRVLRIEANRRLSNFESAARDLRDLAERLAGKERYEQAELYLRQALELQPGCDEYLEMLAEIQAAGGAIEQACETHRHLAEIYRQGGKFELAIRRAQRLLELKPDDVELKDYLAALLIEAGQPGEAIAIWRALADRCAGEGDIDAALARYARILEQRPGDVEILRRLADLTYEVGGMLQAMAYYDRLIDALQAEGDEARIEAEYQRILDLEPGHLQLKERLAEFLHERGRTGEARALLLSIATIYRDERNQWSDTVRVLRHLKALDPEDLDVREQEAVLLEKLERPAEAAQVWRQLGGAHRTAGRKAQAAECLARGAELDADLAEPQIEAAEIFEQMDRIEQATHFYLRAIEIHDRHEKLDPCIAILEQAIRINPGRMDLPDALARIYERLGRMDEAARQWLALGEIYEAQQECLAQAKQVYQHLRARLPGELECRRRLARLFETEGDRTAALRELRELARLAGEAADPEQEADYLMRLLSLDPHDEPSLRALAGVWRRLNWPDELYETLGTLEQLYCTAGQYDEALSTLDELKRLRPDEPELIGRSIDLLIKTGQASDAARQGIELIQIYFDKGDDHHALETLRRVAEIESRNIERRISLARLIHANHREAAALQEFFLSASKLAGETDWAGCLAVCEAGLQSFPDDVRLRDLMGRTLTKLGREGEAIEVQLHLAALYDERGEDARAHRVYELILQDQPDHQATLEAMVEWALRHEKAALAIEHLIRLAESHYMGGRLPASIEALERIQTLDPTRLDLKTRLAEVYLEAGDEAGATRTWLATAAALVSAGRGEAAVEIYERLAGMRPEDLEIAAALAEAYGVAGNSEKHQGRTLRLSELYVERGQLDEALGLLEALGGRYPNEPLAWERLIALYDRLGEVDRTIEAWRRLFEIHRAARRLDQAKRCLEAALELRPGDTDLLEALGDLCLSLSRRAEGVEHLAQAARAMQNRAQHGRSRELALRILKLDPLNLGIRRLLAEGLEALGETAPAMEEYVQAARGYAEQRQNEPAIAILHHLLSLDPRRTDERELYAKLLHREGRGEESIEQYVLLLETFDLGDDPRRAIKYCRHIMAEQPEHPVAHEQLCAIYERTDKLRQAFQECQWLADHYQAQGDLSQAETVILKGLGWFPEELTMHTRLVDLYLRLGRKSEAARQLSALAAMAESRADTKITAWAMNKACEIEPDNIEHVARLADYLDRMGNLAAARQTRLALIRQMLEAGLMEEACALAERVVESVIEDDALRGEIAEMFERAGLPEVSSFHFNHLARRALLEKKYEEAKALARRALRLKPRHVGAREALIEALLAQRENKEASAEYERLYEIYEEAGEWDAAQRTLQSLIDLAPSQPEPRCKLIGLYRKMHREEAMVDQMRRLVEIHVNANDVDAAIQTLRDLLEQRPEDTRARIRFIDLFTQLGDELELRDDYQQLARIFVKKGSVIEATHAYEKVIALQPEEPACREEFAQFLFEQGQVHRAIEETRLLADLLERSQQDAAVLRVLDRALNYAPQEMELRQRLAAAYLRTNRRGLALENYRALARHYEHSGNDTLLIEVTEKIVQIDGMNVEFRQRLADLLHQHGQLDQACEQYHRLAEQYIERNLYDLAEHEYRRILEIRPDDISIWQRVVELHVQVGSMREIVPDLVILGEMYQARDQLKEAVGIYHRILQCDPENLEILTRYIDLYMQIGLEQDLVDDYLALADLRIKRGEVGEAIRIYKHLLEICPDNPVVVEKLTATQRLSRGLPASPEDKPNPRNNGHAAPAEGEAPAGPLPASMIDKVIRNYENVLRLNPGNAQARARLAEMLEQTGEQARADEEWSQAAESFLAKGDVVRSIQISEHYLQRHAEDARARERLSRALVQRDSLRAVDGALAAESANLE